MIEQKDRILIILIITGILFFLFITKTLTSGYHFVDDHEIIRINDDLKSNSLIHVMKEWVNQDLSFTSRFRPLYYIHRVFETSLFGSNFFAWSLYNAILCCIVFVFFFLGMRNLKFSPGESIVFLLISFIGPQSIIWWRLGPAESLGMTFIGLSFYYMSKSINCKNHIINTSLFIFFIILSSLTKESFIIIMPAMIFLKIGIEKEYLWLNLPTSLRKNLLLLLPLIFMIIELLIIRNFIRTDYYIDLNLFDNLKRFLFVGLHFIKTYSFLFLGFAILILIDFRLNGFFRKFDFVSIIFFFLIIIPNILLYANDGLVERYLIPSTFGLGFLIATFVNKIDRNLIWFRRSAISIIIVALLPLIIFSYKDAVAFTNEGRATKELLSRVVLEYPGGTQVMTIVDPVEHYEQSVSLKTYLNYMNKIELFGYPIVKSENMVNYSYYINGWKSYFEKRLFTDLTSKPGLLIFLDSQLIDKFFKESGLIQNDYLAIRIEDSKYALLKEKHIHYPGKN